MLPLKIVGTDRLDGDALIVEYSDMTSAVYSIQQINKLIPVLKVSPLDDLNDKPSG